MHNHQSYSLNWIKTIENFRYFLHFDSRSLPPSPLTRLAPARPIRGTFRRPCAAWHSVAWKQNKSSPCRALPSLYSVSCSAPMLPRHATPRRTTDLPHFFFLLDPLLIMFRAVLARGAGPGAGAEIQSAVWSGGARPGTPGRTHLWSIITGKGWARGEGCYYLHPHHLHCYYLGM